MQGGGVRIYGEMVDRLWFRGQSEAALKVATALGYVVRNRHTHLISITFF